VQQLAQGGSRVAAGALAVTPSATKKSKPSIFPGINK
jgi:hypothetical protein